METCSQKAFWLSRCLWFVEILCHSCTTAFKPTCLALKTQVHFQNVVQSVGICQKGPETLGKKQQKSFLHHFQNHSKCLRTIFVSGLCIFEHILTNFGFYNKFDNFVYSFIVKFVRKCLGGRRHEFVWSSRRKNPKASLRRPLACFQELGA